MRTGELALRCIIVLIEHESVLLRNQSDRPFSAISKSFSYVLKNVLVAWGILNEAVSISPFNLNIPFNLITDLIADK